MVKCFAIIGALYLVLPSNTFSQETRLSGPDESASDHYGRSVSISGDVALVSAWLDDDLGENTGAVYVYNYDGGLWTETQKLKASDATTGSGFGSAIALLGDIAVVGASNDDERGQNAGAAYVFRFNGTVWIEQQKIVPTDVSEDDRFGHAVSVSEDLIVVGSPLDTGLNSRSGSSYVFRFDGVDWVEEQRLVASDGQENDEFGVSVSISKKNMIVGTSSGIVNNPGAAYLFGFNGLEWVETQKIQSSDSIDGDHFGRAVSIWENLAIVGANKTHDLGLNSGAAYVYDKVGSIWIEQQKLLATDGDAENQFGSAVAINGDHALIGAWLDDDRGLYSGSAYVFENNSGNWKQLQKLVASDGGSSDYFGYAVSLTDSHLFVGTRKSIPNASWLLGSGAAYLYRLDSMSSTGSSIVDSTVPRISILFQNYPNPFYPTTSIRFDLPQRVHTTLTIFNVMGQEVKRLIDRPLESGSHEVSWDASRLLSGLYFYSLTAGDIYETKKMMLVK